MKLNNILLFLFISVLMSLNIFANTNPVVTNVAFSISGTTVTVTYDVTDAEQNTVTILMYVSDDGGTTYEYNYGTATGNIGTGVTTGAGKSITWTYAGAFANYKIKIVANDETADGSPCPVTPTVIYDGKTYNTVQIGDQCWLKENLDVGTMINSSSAQSNNLTIEKYCYNNDANNCTTYGGLYQWNEAMQYSATEGSQGICPSGWHIPTNNDLQILINTVNNSSYSLEKIGVGSGTNTSGFSAYFAGNYRSDINSFTSLSQGTLFWISKEHSDLTKAYLIVLSSFSASINPFSDNGDKNYGSSVRCIKD